MMQNCLLLLVLSNVCHPFTLFLAAFALLGRKVHVLYWELTTPSRSPQKPSEHDNYKEHSTFYQHCF